MLAKESQAMIQKNHLEPMEILEQNQALFNENKAKIKNEQVLFIV